MDENLNARTYLNLLANDIFLFAIREIYITFDDYYFNMMAVLFMIHEKLQFVFGYQYEHLRNLDDLMLKFYIVLKNVWQSFITGEAFAKQW